MQADVKKRRPVCFSQHIYRCFSRFQTLELSPDRDRSLPSSDDLPTVWLDPSPKLSMFSESLGNRGYRKVAIGCGARNEQRNPFFPVLLGIGSGSLAVPNDGRQIRPTQPITPHNS